MTIGHMTKAYMYHYMYNKLLQDSLNFANPIKTVNQELISIDLSDDDNTISNENTISNVIQQTNSYNEPTDTAAMIDLSDERTHEHTSLSQDSSLIDLSEEEGNKERGVQEEKGPWEEDEFDEFDNLFDEESLILVDQEEVINDEEGTIDNDELSPSEGFVKTLQEMAEEEEKDVYDPVILGTSIGGVVLLCIYDPVNIRY